MAANTFGNLFRITTFGESHGGALGVVVDGCPAGIPFDESLLKSNLERRRPGLQAGTSARDESDTPEILSGVYKGHTLGTPIAMMVRNRDARSQDYENLPPRPGHADDVWMGKFGFVDPRGGGRSSGRETVARVLGGSVAEMLIKKISPQTRVIAFSYRLGPFVVGDWPDLKTWEKQTALLGFPSEKAQEVQKFLVDAQKSGESYGGTVGLEILRPPEYLGQPVFHKLKADLAGALMSIGATTAIELGDGVAAAAARGTEFHPCVRPDASAASVDARAYGGIRGGLSTGESITLKVHFKPTSSVLDIAKKGRHDPCIVPRALPVVEAMVNLVVADHLLWRSFDRG